MGRHFPQLLALAACVLALAGCAGVPLESAQAERRATETPRDYAGCVAAVAAKPEHERMRAKLHLSTSEPYPPPRLADKSYPEADDIEALRTLNAELRDCRAMELAAAEPAARQAIADSHAAEDKLWLEAEGGRLSWGRLNARRKGIAERKLAAAKRQMAATTRPTTPRQTPAQAQGAGGKRDAALDLNAATSPVRAERGYTPTPGPYDIGHYRPGERVPLFCDQFYHRGCRPR